jgi:hypothetical protein
LGEKAKKPHFTAARAKALAGCRLGPQKTTGDELAASKPSSIRQRGENLLFNDGQRERHSRKLRSPLVGATDFNLAYDPHGHKCEHACQKPFTIVIFGGFAHPFP